MTKEYLKYATLRAVGGACLLIAGVSPATHAAEPSYDRTRNYICSHCSDWQSATAFVQSYVKTKPCESGDPTYPDGGGGNDSGGGNGSGDSGGGRTPGVPGGPGGGISPYATGPMTTDLRGNACAEPDERAVVLHPETEQIYTFIVERRSQARDGAPPIAYRYPGLLSFDERERLGHALDIYKEYVAMSQAVSTHMTEWVRDRQGRSGPTAMTTATDDDLSCPEYTALDTLSDLEKWSELRREAGDELTAEFERRFEDDEGVIISGGWAQVSGGLVGGGVDFDVERADDVLEQYTVAFSFKESEDARRGMEYLETPDYLVFEFKVSRDLFNSRVIADVRLDERESRIHGVRGFLKEAESKTNPENLDPCSFERVKEALRTGVVSGGGNSGGGGGAGGLTLVRINGGTPTVTNWVCGSGTCCKSDGTCVPAGEIMPD